MTQGKFDPNMPHGYMRYVSRKCRCDICVSAHSEWNNAYQRANAGKLKAGDPRHGTLNGYTSWRCRCADCREAMTSYRRARKAVAS